MSIVMIWEILAERLKTKVACLCIVQKRFVVYPDDFWQLHFYMTSWKPHIFELHQWAESDKQAESDFSNFTR